MVLYAGPATIMPRRSAAAALRAVMAGARS